MPNFSGATKLSSNLGSFEDFNSFCIGLQASPLSSDKDSLLTTLQIIKKIFPEEDTDNFLKHFDEYRIIVLSDGDFLLITFDDLAKLHFLNRDIRVEVPEEDYDVGCYELSRIPEVIAKSVENRRIKVLGLQIYLSQGSDLFE